MIDDLSFVNDRWFWQILLAALVIWGIFVWKERSRFGRPRFFINVIVALLAVVCLALIALRPTTSVTRYASNLVLLTEGYEELQLDSLKKKYIGLAVRNYKVGKPIVTSSGTPESIFILGYGIRPFDLWQLDSLKAFYLGGSESVGVTQVKYRRETNVGDQAIFGGRYSNASAGHRMVLADPSGKMLDSVTLTSEKTQEFRLSAPLKASGSFLFELIEKDSVGSIISRDPLPVTVTDQNPLQILVLSDFPTFETKYLKNFLADNGHQVVVRSGLTRGRFKYEYFNMASRPAISFTQEGLKPFDLLITDAASLRKLSRSGRETLGESVREEGLGVFVIPDNSVFTSGVPLREFEFTRNRRTLAISNDPLQVKMSVFPYEFSTSFSLQPMHTSTTETLSGYQPLGTGRIGTSVIRNTYELVLSGQTNAYRQLWSGIVETIGKKETSVTAWSADAMVGFPDEPYSFQLRTLEEEPSVLTSEGNRVPLKQDYDIATLWEGTTYPRGTGWKSLSTESDSTGVFNYYVADTSQWRSVVRYNTVMANQRYFDPTSTTDYKEAKIRQVVNPLWFFLVFMGCMGYLWLEPKV